MKRVVMLMLALMLLLSGCGKNGRGREPENMVLARVLGVDWTGQEYILTAVGMDGSGGAVKQTVRDAELSRAFETLPGAGEKWVSLTNVTQFILGDGVEPQAVLTYIMDESGMSWRGCVWYAGVAAALMQTQEDGGMARLELMEQGGEDVVSVRDALAGLAQEGDMWLPALGLRDGKLYATGRIYYQRRGEGM